MEVKHWGGWEDWYGEKEVGGALREDEGFGRGNWKRKGLDSNESPKAVGVATCHLNIQVSKNGI